MARLALIINTLNAYEGNGNSLTDISEKSMKSAKKLIDYFINNAKKVKLDITNTKDLKGIIETNKGKNNNELIKIFFENDPDFNKSIAAQLLGISRQQIYRIIKDLK